MAGGLQKIHDLLFRDRAVIAIAAVILLLLIALLPPYGVIAGWLFLVHGFTNTVGITLIYTNADRVLGQLVFT